MALGDIVEFRANKNREANGAGTDYDSGNVYVMLATSAVTPAAQTQTKLNAFTEVTGTNYARKQITDPQGLGDLLQDTGTADVTFGLGADNLTYAQHASGFTTARWAIIYDNTGATDADKDVIAYIDLAQDRGNVNGDLVIAWNASGIWKQ